MLVQYALEGRVARLTLDSPHNHNALSTALVEQLHRGFDDAVAAGARVVVLGHTGRTFCAGADLSEAAGRDPGDIAVDRAQEMTRLLRAIRNGVLRGRASHPRTAPPSAARARGALLASILISSVAFMAMHLYQAPDLTTLLVLGTSTLVLGLANAALATRTGRLGPGIVAHMVFNGVALLGFFATSR